MPIQKRNKKYWINFSYHRERLRLASPDNTVAGAKAYEALLRSRLANGETISKNSNEGKTKLYTFAEFTEEWMEVYAKSNNKDSEYNNKRLMLKGHLLPYFGKMRLDKITNLDIEKFKTEKTKTNLSNKTINNYLIVLNKCFHSALDWEVITKIPKVKLLKVEPQKFDFLSQEELQQLLDNTDGEIHDMILMTAKTGMRHGEMIALSWDDICLKSGMEKITIQKSIYRGKFISPKSNKIRHVPLTRELVEMLSKKAKKTGLLFPSSHLTPLAPYLTRKRLLGACVKAGVRQISWHPLRHTFASHLVQNGVSIFTVKELMGHTDISTTMRYSHLGQMDTMNAIHTLDKKRHKNVTIDISERFGIKNLRLRSAENTL